MAKALTPLAPIDNAANNASEAMERWLNDAASTPENRFAIPWMPIGAVASVIGATASILSFLEEKDQTAYLQNISDRVKELQSDIKDIKRDVEKILELVMGFDDLLNEQDRREASRNLVALVELGVEKLPGWIKEVKIKGQPSQTFLNFHMDLQLAIKRADDFPEDSANVSLGVALNVSIMRVLDQIDLHPSTLLNHVAYLRKSSKRIDEIANSVTPTGRDLQRKFSSDRQFFGAAYAKNKAIVKNRRFPFVATDLLAEGSIDEWIEASDEGFIPSAQPVSLVTQQYQATGHYIPASYENEIDQFPEMWSPENEFLNRDHVEGVLRNRLWKHQTAYADFRTTQEGLFSQSHGLNFIREQIEAVLHGATRGATN